MSQPAAAVAARSLPDWGPVNLVEALPPGPVALLDGLLGQELGSPGSPAVRRRLTLVAWDPVAAVATLEEALDLAAAAPPLPPGAPPALGAVVGTLGWEGDAYFWLPGSAALFDPAGRILWVRGTLPSIPSMPSWPSMPSPAGRPGTSPFSRAQALWDRRGFTEAVTRAQRQMAEGFLRKVVLSVPFAAPCALTPVAAYRCLAARAAGAPGASRAARPAGFTGPAGPAELAQSVQAAGATDAAASPLDLRFLMDAGHHAGAWALVGTSPEPLVFLSGRRAELHPLAGTRPRGPGMAEALRRSEKDRAEHAVAVEQARQDLAAVCWPETLAIRIYMALEGHPGLIHLASHLVGSLRNGVTGADLLRACFPAGTVSGVPREPARSLIRELEPQPRRWYAGAVGALLPGGDLQLWITIRSALLEGGTARVQTGAGVVPESDPEAEWRECLAKAAPTLSALDPAGTAMAEGGKLQ